LHLITLNHTHTRARAHALSRNPLDEGSACHRDLYLTAQNTHRRQTSMFPAGFEHVIQASERPQTHTLERAATGIGTHMWVYLLRTN